MPEKKQYRPVLATILILVLFAGFGWGQSDEDILDYYWQKAADAWSRRRNADESVRYRLTTQSFYKSLDRKGRVSSVDTAEAVYYYSGTVLDSAVFSKGEEGRFTHVELTPFDVFDRDYVKYLYPNDDGVGDLAIGLDTKPGDDTIPSGMLMLNRRSYLPSVLYLYSPPEGEMVRFTRSFRFFEYNGLIVPDSVWVVASRRGVFFPEYFRVETGVTDIEVYR